MGSRALWGCMGWLSGALLARPPRDFKSNRAYRTKTEATVAKMRWGRAFWALPTGCPDATDLSDPVTSPRLILAARFCRPSGLPSGSTSHYQGREDRQAQAPVNGNASARLSHASGTRQARVLHRPPHRHSAGRNLSRFGTELASRTAGTAHHTMKQPATRALFEYWDALRGTRPAPERSDIEPGAIRSCLANTFVLAADAAHGHPFRIAGTSCLARCSDPN